MEASRRFAYYNRLSAKEKADYRLSDAISVIMLPDVPALQGLVQGVEVALASGKRVRVAKAVTALVAAILAQVEAPPVKVHVREVRPDLEDAELHGLYTYGADGKPPALEVWMRTRALAKVVKLRTFIRTIIHEVLHHLDVTIFGMEDTFHTEGFFRRESSIIRALFDTPKRPPREPRAQLSLFGERSK